MTRSKRRGRRGRGAESSQRGRLFGAMKKIIARLPPQRAAARRKRRGRKKFPARRFRPSSRRRRRTRRRISITFIICASSPDHQKAPPLLLRSRRDRAGRRRRFSSSNSGASVYPHKLRRDVYARQLAHFFVFFLFVFFPPLFSLLSLKIQVYLSKLCRCCSACACVRVSLRFAPRAGQMFSLSRSRSDLLFSSEDACV